MKSHTIRGLSGPICSLLVSVNCISNPHKYTKMIFSGSHPPKSPLFLTLFMFLFPYQDLAFPLIQNATDPYSNLAVECNDSEFWVNLGYYTHDCRHVLENYFLTLVSTMGDRDIEFVSQGYPGHTGLPIISLPAKFRSGPSLHLIATLS